QQNSPLTVESYAIFEMTHYDLVVAVNLYERIELEFSYNPKRLEEETARRLGGHITRVIEEIALNTPADVTMIDLLTEEEKQRILIDFNDTASVYPKDKTIHQLFEDQVQRTPDALAVVHASKRLTYKQLNRRTDQTAHLLHQEGVGVNSIAAVMSERSLEMVIGILGILKAGAAYLPIDPRSPGERIDFMLKDSEAKVLVSWSDGFVVRRLDASSERTNKPINHQTNNPTNLAYIIYTSGSTGTPKGVVVEHRAVVNTLTALSRAYPFGETDVYLLKTAYIFDVSVTELFGWFFGGGALAVLDAGGEKDPSMMLDAIEAHRVTHLNFIPSMFTGFMEAIDSTTCRQLTSLRYIFLAGEALLPHVVNKFRSLSSHVRLENLYGPTEAAIYASMYSLSGWGSGSGIPIGKPLPNVTLLVLGVHGWLQPVGVAGELCIGGDGLARGYLNRPALTAERFLNFSHGQTRTNTDRTNTDKMFYQTGDLARWLPDGNIEFLGRIDHQVKVRGFRIELGEIENRLLKHEEIKEAVVIAREGDDGDKYLCGYIVVTGGELEVTALRDFLSKTLPDYMIPSYFVHLDRIPLTPGGKINREALPIPGPGIKTGEDYVAPQNQMEEQLVEIWSALLNIEKEHLGVEDNFFLLGGHSLKATLLVSRLHKYLGVKVPLARLFKHNTIRELAGYIDDIDASSPRAVDYTSIAPVESKEYYPLSSAQKRLVVLHRLEEGGTGYNMPGVFRLDGALDKDKLESAFRELIRRHESLRTSFHLVREESVQQVHPAVPFDIRYRDITDGSASPDQIIDRFIRPFDLSAAPLLRVQLVTMEEERHLLLFDMHHIISDGVSMEIFTREFMALVEVKQLPERCTGLQYKDYSHWQNQRLSTDHLKRRETYWLQQFEDDVPRLELPYDFPRPAVKSHRGGSEEFVLEAGLFRRLKQVTHETGTTPFMVLLAMFNLLLAKLSGQEDIVVGSAAAGRKQPDRESIVGIFINTLALRNYPSIEKPFSQFLAEVKRNF
ncbi:MAG: amino acid adenylation domain-containing protein, partial [bacterium]|nr:amino acid adenylation domain-containing protein [bacterium]